MKRIGMLFPFLLLLFSSSTVLPAAPAVAAESCYRDCSELPWATVDAVLKRVDELYTEYTYNVLVEWYSVSLLTVEQVGTAYEVRIYDEDGLDVILLLDHI